MMYSNHGNIIIQIKYNDSINQLIKTPLLNNKSLKKYISMGIRSCAKFIVTKQKF